MKDLKFRAWDKILRTMIYNDFYISEIGKPCMVIEKSKNNPAWENI